jgi:hypothetical protein
MFNNILTRVHVILQYQFFSPNQEKQNKENMREREREREIQRPRCLGTNFFFFFSDVFSKLRGELIWC